LIVATSTVSTSPQPLLASSFTTHSLPPSGSKERRKWPTADFRPAFFHARVQINNDPAIKQVDSIHAQPYFISDNERGLY
jgi:hypothetical protein